LQLEEIADLFQLSPHNRALLLKQARQQAFEQPGPVIHKGQPVSGAYLVMQGLLRVYTYSPQGAEATLYFLRPGETCVLTLNCLFNDLRYPAWVETFADTRVCMIPGGRCDWDRRRPVGIAPIGAWCSTQATLRVAADEDVGAPRRLGVQPKRRFAPQPTRTSALPGG
jgi:hypothetical protein